MIHLNLFNLDTISHISRLVVSVIVYTHHMKLMQNEIKLSDDTIEICIWYLHLFSCISIWDGVCLVYRCPTCWIKAVLNSKFQQKKVLSVDNIILLLRIIAWILEIHWGSFVSVYAPLFSPLGNFCSCPSKIMPDVNYLHRNAILHLRI